MGCCGSAPEQVFVQKPSEVAVGSLVTAKPIRRMSLLTNRIGSITEKYRIIGALGCDEIGTLFHAIEIQTDSMRTIREVSKHSIPKDINIFQEYNILRELDHPNIIKIFEAFETQKSFFIVLENISGGKLTDKYKKSGYEGAVASYVHELFSALNYLSTQHIVHCNLNQEFIVLSSEDDDAVLKIIGFTHAHKLQSSNSVIEDFQVRYETASPEVLNGQVSDKSDLWSAGVILYNLFTARHPFPRGSRETTIEAIKQGNVDYHNSGFTILSDIAQDLIKSILIVDPKLRPSAEKILSHPWFHESKQTLPITYNIAKKLSTFTIKSHIAKCILTYITLKLSSSKKEYSIINYFKSLDLNNDGKVSKEEILNVFTQVGLNVESEIDLIMMNLDYDNSGFIDYTELVLALTNWPQELKQKNLRKAFVVDSGYIEMDEIRIRLPHFEDTEWDEFIEESGAGLDKISLRDLKDYLRNKVHG